MRPDAGRNSGGARSTLIERQDVILVVEDEEAMQFLFKEILESPEMRVETAGSGEEALEKLQHERFNLLIVDKNLPRMSGLEVIGYGRKLYPDLEAIVITADPSLESSIEAVRLGVYDYLLKPLDNLDEVVQKVRKALDRHHLAHENRVLLKFLQRKNIELQKANEELKKAKVETEMFGEIQRAQGEQVQDELEQARRVLEHISAMRSHLEGQVLKNLNQTTSTLRSLTEQLSALEGGDMEEMGKLLGRFDEENHKLYAITDELIKMVRTIFEAAELTSGRDPASP